ncbi:hypothetical protein E3N88_46207 [Mikania micrantha]|uniref:Protein kinase domain-containing protein n=1 Tax=Mikania micrantha TaxID=192012 RepID=A0A5N6L776_9ASTR|nr:hypothetical protein E3N88_46207 [Mikania micrantha]
MRSIAAGLALAQSSVADKVLLVRMLSQLRDKLTDFECALKEQNVAYRALVNIEKGFQADNKGETKGRRPDQFCKFHASVFIHFNSTSAFSSSIIMAFATGKESAPSTSSTQPSVSCRHFEFPEILMATENFSESGDEYEWGLVTWVQDSIKEENLKNIIDLDTRGEISPKCLKEYVKLAKRCLHNSPKHRPTMAEILSSLESVMAIQEKSNNSLQAANRTLFGRIVNLFPFTSNQENSVQGDIKLSTNSKGNKKFPRMKEDSADFPRGFGKVFLGWVEENTLIPSKQGVGMAVAVKRLSQVSGQGVAEWQAELNLLGHLAHPNIIRLLGYSTNGDFNAKLGGFGLARNNGLETWETSVTTKIVGSFGYIAPEYMETGHVTTMCDIYSFGVFLLESITGRNAVDAQRPKKERNMVYWATHVGSNIKKIMDPRLEGKYPLHGASEYVALALKCVAGDPKNRPSAEEVLQSLEQIYALN